MLDLEAARCACQLDALYYFPGYYTEEEERQLLTTIRSSQTKWVQLSGRRLQNHGGIVHTKGLIPSSLPRWLQGLADRLHTDIPLFGDKAPNHVLINSYNPGEGIMPHQDGPLYLPVVAILSLGAPAVLRFWKKQPEGGTGGSPPVASLLAAPRSLLVFTGDAYEQCLHGIEEVDTEQLDPSIANLATAGVPLPHTTTITNSARTPPTTAVAAAAQAPSCMQPGAAGSSGEGKGTPRPPTPLADAPAAGSQATHQAAADSAEPPGPVSPAEGGVLQPCGNLPKDAGGEVCDKPGAASAAPDGGAAAQQQEQKASQQQQQQQQQGQGQGQGQGVPRGGERISLTVRHVLKVHRGLLVGKR